MVNLTQKDLEAHGFTAAYQEGDYTFYRHPSLHFQVGLKEGGRFLGFEVNRKYYLGKVRATPEKLQQLLTLFQ